jgi:LysM repeat protein
MSRRRWSAAVLALAVSLVADAEAGGARSHTVYSGQTLGMIAKRYNVTVEALCTANGIRQRDPIRPGQELVIPTRDGKVGDAGATERKSSKAAAEPAKAANSPLKTPSPATGRVSNKASASVPKVHTVYSGQTLGMIARRYHVTIDALCHANDIARRAPIRPDQRLIVPTEDDEDGTEARRLRLAGFLNDPTVALKKKADRDKHRDWTTYRRPARKRGYITLRSNGRSWSGYVLGPGDRLLPKAQQKVSDALASWRTGKRVDIDDRLIALIARVSDTFGGRALQVVSGYREHSHSSTSRHPKGRALDLSVEGVPNWALRDYLRTLDGVGVGYYPNSSFVHMDVREERSYWIDYAGPGESPRYARSE